jgi:uncharacterized membrane protein
METATSDKPLTYHMDLGQVRQQLGMPSGRAKNVGETERWASMVGGGALVAYGLSRRTPMGVGLALLGGMLFHRGSSGHCDIYQKMGVNTRQ